MDYSFNELGSTRPKFTERIQRDVYDAIVSHEYSVM